jgi:DNA-binding transcriptional LysR family regulator
MKLDRLDGLVAFHAAASARSFTAAAAALDVTPQAISRAIAVLEARLGVRLLNRTTRSVGVTEAGARFLSSAGRALDDVYEALENLQESKHQAAGILRLNLPRPAFSGLVQPGLAAFHVAYPAIHLELGFDDGFVDIVERGFDAGIRLGESVARDMVGVPLSRREAVAIVAAPEYLRRRGTPQRIEDLREHDCIRFRFPGSGAAYRWELRCGERELDFEVAGPITVNDTAALVAAALDGLGLAYVLECTARAALRDGRLVRVLPEAGPVLPGFHLYYPSRRQLPPKLRCFIEHFRAPPEGRNIR